MQAWDVMTNPVITVATDATIDEMAALMLGKGVGAVSVVDVEGSLFGTASEADLLHRPEIDTERRCRR
jgi:CBS domain-containing protein